MNYLKESILLFESLEDGEEYDFSDIPESNIIKGIIDELGLGLKFVFIFGTGIGAFINPVKNLIQNGGVNMSNEEVSLLLITAFAILLRESSVDINKLKNVLNKKGLIGYLGTVTDFIKSSKKLLSVVAETMGKITYNISDVLGFTFMLVPTMDVISEIINTSHVTPESFGNVIAGLAGSISLYGIKVGLKKWLSKKNDKSLNENEINVFDGDYDHSTEDDIETDYTEDDAINDEPIKVIVNPSKKVLNNVCRREKICDEQGDITFGQLERLINTYHKKRIGVDIGGGVYKSFIRLLPWFIPQIAIGAFIGSTMRAINKIVKPALESTKGYKTWWGAAVINVMNLAEGELPTDDPFSKIFFISDGLLEMLSDKYKYKFARYISEIAASKSDNEVVPEYFVENELRNYINQKFLLNPPLPFKVRPSDDNKPYNEYIEEGYYIRTFSEDTDDMELVWHRDREDRIVEGVGDTDWMIQMDNELPKPLTESIYIPKETYHRVIKGSGNLKVKVKKL